MKCFLARMLGLAAVLTLCGAAFVTGHQGRFSSNPVAAVTSHLLADNALAVDPAAGLGNIRWDGGSSSEDEGPFDGEWAETWQKPGDTTEDGGMIVVDEDGKLVWRPNNYGGWMAIAYYGSGGSDTVQWDDRYDWYGNPPDADNWYVENGYAGLIGSPALLTFLYGFGCRLLARRRKGRLVAVAAAGALAVTAASAQAARAASPLCVGAYKGAACPLKVLAPDAASTHHMRVVASNKPRQ